MEAGKRMIISYLVKVLCREFAIYYRLAITTNNITSPSFENALNNCFIEYLTS